MVVEADPAVLGRNDMQRGVRHSFLDQSTSVREAAVDLVGKFVLSRPELIDKYYDMLSTRILVSPVTVTVLDITFGYSLKIISVSLACIVFHHLSFLLKSVIFPILYSSQINTLLSPDNVL
jgi:hypothetical protein